MDSPPARTVPPQAQAGSLRSQVPALLEAPRAYHRIQWTKLI